MTRPTTPCSGCAPAVWSRHNSNALVGWLAPLMVIVRLHNTFDMFGFFKKKADEPVAHQPPGQIFPWPRGTVLTALDEATIALPMAIFGKDEPIGSVVFGPADIQMNIPKQGDTFFIRLQAGMSVSLAKSCQARVVADDKQPRRFRISQNGA